MMRCVGLGVVFGLLGCAPPSDVAAHRDASAVGGHRRAVFALRDEQRAADYPLAFSELRPELDRMRARAGERTGFVQPDLDAVRSFAIPAEWTDARARSWAAEMEAETEWMVLRLEPTPSPEDIAPSTPSYVDGQGYLEAEGGIGAAQAHAMGLRGAGLTIHEVEYGWRTSHEDLVDVDVLPEAGQTVAQEALMTGLAPEHGTASVGMLVAPHNGYGIDGLVPDAQLRTYPEWSEEDGLRRSEAVASAISQAQPGDIVMLQMQAQHPATGQLGPAELEQDVWMLTRMASDAGVLVVAAGGNGAFDLDGVDAAEYRERGHSGAILVGAGDPQSRAPLSFSSHGQRIDLQGWGSAVFTLGYGDHARLGDDDDQAYTASFEGTSAALPMVVASAALVSEAWVSSEGTPPEPEDLRRLLVATGQLQAQGVNVGPRPDVPAALSWVGARESDPPDVVIVEPASSVEAVVDLDGVLVLPVEVEVDDVSPIYAVEVEVDGEAWSDADRSAPYAFELALGEGEHIVRARAVDAWGNTAVTAPLSVDVVVESKGSSSGGDADTSGDPGDSSSGATSHMATGGGGSGCTMVTGDGRRGRSLAMSFCVLLLFRRRARRKTASRREV